VPSETWRSVFAEIWTLTKPALQRLRFYAIALFVLGSLYEYQSYEFKKPYFQTNQVISSAPLDQSSFLAWQQLEEKAASEYSSLLTTLATALVGALGWMMVEARKDSKKRHTKLQHVWAAFLAAICAGVSLYYGSLSQKSLLIMLWSQNVDPLQGVYSFLARNQFVALGAGALFFADFAFHDFGKGDSNEKPQNPADAVSPNFSTPSIAPKPDASPTR